MTNVFAGTLLPLMALRVISRGRSSQVGFGEKRTSIGRQDRPVRSRMTRFGSRAAFADLAPVQKRLRSFSAQFHDFRPVRAQIATARRRTRAIGLHEGLE